MYICVCVRVCVCVYRRMDRDLGPAACMIGGPEAWCCPEYDLAGVERHLFRPGMRVLRETSRGETDVTRFVLRCCGTF